MQISKIGTRSPLSFGYKNGFKALHKIDSNGGAALPNATRFKSGAAAPTAADQARALQEADARASALIRAMGQPMFQDMQTNTIGSTALGNTFTYNLSNVGLNRRVILEITGTITPSSGEVLTASPFGIFNLLQRVTLTDLSNYNRIDTKGRHLFMVASARKRGAYGAAFVNDSPARVANNYAVNSAPAQIGAATTFRVYYELPLAYAPDDYRGAIWANVTGGTWRVALQFASTAQMFAGSATTDLSEVVYKDSTATSTATLTNVSCKIYQDYIDQVPTNPQTGRYILPTMSLAYNYLLLMSPQSGITASSDFPVQYTNFRTFLSTIAEYINNGAMNAGSDVNYWGIQVANQVFIRRVDPFTAALQTRELIGDDFPAGVYYFDHREKPIVTNQSGNTQLVLNASSATSASMNVFWEMLSVQNQALNATSLSGS